MILTRLILHNYKQHENLEVEFAGNVIVVVGPNGSGKSNLLGAIHFAFAGEQPGFKKSHLLRWGSTSGGVELHFTHDGVDYVLSRSLTSSTVTLTPKDGDATRGATKVAERIEELMGLDKDLLKQTIFVRQAEIDSVLFTDPRVRTLAFQKLCGLGDAATVHKRLGEALSGLQAPPNYDEQIAEGKAQLATMQARVREIESQAAAAQTQRSTCPDQATLETSMATYNAVQPTLESYVTTTRAIEQAEHQLADLAKQTVERTAYPDIDPTTVDGEITLLEQLFSQSVDHENKTAAYKSAGEAMIAMGDQPFTAEQIRDFNDKAGELVEAYQTLKAQTDMYGEFFVMAQAVPDVNMTTECPMCGTSVSPNQILERLQGKIGALEPQLTTAVAASTMGQQAASQAQTQQTHWQAGYAVGLKQFQAAERAMQTVQAVQEPAGDIRVRLDELKQHKDMYFTAMAEKTRLETASNGALQTRDRLVQQLADLETRLVSVSDVKRMLDEGSTIPAIHTYVTQRVAELRGLASQAQLIEQQIAKLTGMLEELTAALSGLENTVATLEFKRTQQDAYREAVDTLNRTRDWFHYNNGPHTFSLGVLGDMSDDINEFLQQFSAPFSVQHTTDTLEFECLFHDGRAMPDDGPPTAQHLSGGEKIQLAVSFRFAGYCMFANKLGLLSLDEPTVYLDEDNVARFCKLLQKIKEVAQAMGLQVLISTHERAVIPFADGVIELGGETEELTLDSVLTDGGTD